MSSTQLTKANTHAIRCIFNRSGLTQVCRTHACKGRQRSVHPKCHYCWRLLSYSNSQDKAKHQSTLLCLLALQQKDSDAPNALTQTEETQVLSDLHRSAWRRPQILCSSGLSLPRQLERRGSHKRSGCVRRLPQFPSWSSRPRLSPQTLSLHCWQTHYAATCGSQSCGSPLRTETEGKERIRDRCFNRYTELQ